MTALVSAIIPTYNRADLLGDAIRGALAQPVPGLEVEIIVVDDGSTDHTPDVVRTFPSVRYLRQANQREGAARNFGAARASGTYFAFCDSDDFWLAGKLAADVARFGAADAPALVYSRALNVDVRGRSLGVRRLATHEGDAFWELAREAFMPMSSVAVRADVFRACGGFVEDRDLSGTADWELWMRIAARRPVGFVDQARTCIRVHAAHMLSDPTYMRRAMLAGVDHALRDPVVARRASGRTGFVRAHMDVTIALNLYSNGFRRAAWPWLARALRTWPPIAADPRFLGAVLRASVGPTTLKRLRRFAPA